MIAGAYKGFGALPKDWYDIFKEANPALDFEWAAEELVKIARERISE